MSLIRVNINMFLIFFFKVIDLIKTIGEPIRLHDLMLYTEIQTKTEEEKSINEISDDSDLDEDIRIPDQPRKKSIYLRQALPHWWERIENP